MELLPQDSAEFHQAEYWDSFFRKRGAAAFEWYGEFGELCGELTKYCRPSDTILQVGCGNSRLASDMYDVGYRSITSIDISALAVEGLAKQNKQKRPELKFEQMDVTQMSYSDGHFSAVLDKGTLDALYTDTSPEVEATVQGMWEEVERVTRVGGRYLAVSLLQPHILTGLLAWFSPRPWAVRIARCREAETARPATARVFPVWLVVCTRLRCPFPAPLLELQLADSQTTRLPDTAALASSVRGCQQFSAVRAGLAAGAGDPKLAEVSLDLASPGEAGPPRYSLHLADSPNTSGNSLPFAVFLVPQGREVEWQFSTAAGRTQLAGQAGAARLVVAHLGRQQGHSMEAAQADLTAAALDLAPPDLPAGYRIPFLSAGPEQVGERVERCRGNSALSGQYVVEDVRVTMSYIIEGVSVGSGWVRRLVFLARPNLTQSEAVLRVGKKGKRTVDKSVLASSYHCLMVGALGHYLAAPCRVLVIGLGGGSLPLYLHHTFPLTNTRAVELDPAIVRVARDQFAFQPDGRLTVTEGCGLQFVKETEEQFSLVMIDVDSKDVTSAQSCPPAAFLAPDYLARLAATLVPAGMLVLNLVCRDPTARTVAAAALAAVWRSVVSVKLEEDVNEIFFCSDSEKLRTGDVKKTYGQAFRLVNDQARKVNKGTEDLIDLEDTMKLLKLSS